MRTQLLLIAATLLVSCGGNKSKLYKPELLGGKPLPEGYVSPDGLAIGPGGYIYVAINQSGGNWKYPGKIARISPDDQIEDFFTLPVNSTTGVSSPLGITFARDGNLYVSENQSFATDAPNMAGVTRVVIEDGKPVRGELVVDGFNMSNGITAWKDAIYVVETNLGTKNKHTSGVYRFTLDELKSGDTIRVKGHGDPHLILAFETRNKQHPVGANGLAFDSKGNLYVNNFGDVEVLKYRIEEHGNHIHVRPEGVLCQPEGMLSLDGMQIDRDDYIWTTDFRNNSVCRINTRTGESEIIAHNDVPAAGEKGELDAPSECIRRGSKVYVSNIDTDYDNSQIADPIQTISVITLKE